MRTTVVRRALAFGPVALATAAAATFAPTRAAAQRLPIPVTTVLGTDTFSGPSFTVPTALSDTTTLSLTATGIVYLQGPGRYGTNAAGVVVVPGTHGVGDGYVNVVDGFYFGSLLLGNPTLGFRQLFATDAANGWGSAAPPTTLTLTDVPLSSIFGGGLAEGTVLEFRVSDFITDDNSGSFTVSGAFSVVATPEPATYAMLLAGLAGIGAVARRRGQVLTRRPGSGGRGGAGA